MRTLNILFAASALALLGSCGGGGGSDFGSGGSGSGSQTIPSSGANVATLTVDAGPAQNSVNTAYLSVEVCAPGSTTNCATVDHIEIDTGSYGLRIIASALPSSFVLPAEVDASSNPIIECTVFADGVSWGPVVQADIHISGEAAAQVPMQIIGSSSVPAPPTDCSDQGQQLEDTVALFGANGILGVGPFVEDDGLYYSCPQGACSVTTVNIAQEVSNPVAFFAADNNGAIVELPAVGVSGVDSLTGSLVFGIGTEANNGLGSAAIYGLDNMGNLSTSFNGTTFDASFIDSGSNANYFADSSIPTCSDGFFCPTSTLSLQAAITGVNSVSAPINFSVANADTLFNSNPAGVAFVNLAAPNSMLTSFDWGLPFFFGQNVFVAIAGQPTPAGNGPYVAF